MIELHVPEFEFKLEDSFSKENHSGVRSRQFHILHLDFHAELLTNVTVECGCSLLTTAAENRAFFSKFPPKRPDYAHAYIRVSMTTTLEAS